MKQTYRIAGAVIVLFGMSIADIPDLSVQLVPEAQAFRGRGAAFVVGAAVGSSRSSAADANAAAAQQQAMAAQQQAEIEKEKAAAAQQQAAAAQQQAAAAQQQAGAAQQQAAAVQQQSAAAQPQAAAPAAGTSLPVGTVVPALPAGCTPKTVGGVAYRVCGNDFCRAAFQGSTLVYVTAQPQRRDSAPVALASAVALTMPRTLARHGQETPSSAGLTCPAPCPAGVGLIRSRPAVGVRMRCRRHVRGRECGGARLEEPNEHHGNARDAGALHVATSRDRGGVCAARNGMRVGPRRLRPQGRACHHVHHAGPR